MTKSTGRILIESAEAWNTFLTALRDRSASRRGVKLPIPGEDEQLVLEIFTAENLIVFTFKPRRRRSGVALPVAERSE